MADSLPDAPALQPERAKEVPAPVEQGGTAHLQRGVVVRQQQREVEVVVFHPRLGAAAKAVDRAAAGDRGQSGVGHDLAHPLAIGITAAGDPADQRTLQFPG